MSNDGKRNSRELFEERLRKSLRVDNRYSVLDFKFANNYLYILTDSISNAIHISDVYQKNPPGFRIKVKILPDKSVGTNDKGICHVGAAPVRKSGDSTDEQVTQVLYGETFDVLQVETGWVRCRLHADGYVGWVSFDQVTLFDDDSFYDFQFLPKVHAAVNVVAIHDGPAQTAPVIREAVYGASLSVTGNHGKFLEISLPDGGTGWVEKALVKEIIRPKEFSVEGLLGTAHRFQGISYVWGGRSAKGFDCSGFVQTVYGLNGIDVPRDADMQFSAGIKLGKNLNKLRAGDLLFFSSDGYKISHVAIYIGKKKEFIHSSGFVRINSFDRKKKNFSRKLLSAFVGACRVI
jgi:hypothetical protein